MNVTYFEINHQQVLNMLHLARVGRRDVFLDLGSGKGLAVRMAVTHSHASKSIGVEKNFEYYEIARKKAIRTLSHNQLERVEFWLGDINNEDWSPDDNNFVFNYKKATIVYDSLGQTEDDITFYKKRLRKSVRLVKKDLPLVGYRPTGVSRNSKGCWFFLMRFPLKRVRSETQWCYYVLGKKGKKMKDVYSYYRKQLQDHFRNVSNQRQLVESSVRDLKRVIAKRPFPLA